MGPDRVAMVSYLKARLRFCRLPLLFTILLVPLGLLLYFYQDPFLAWSSPHLQLAPEFIQPSLEDYAEQPLSSIPSSKVLLVSSFYPLGYTKHHNRDYSKWLSLFLGQITTDVYIFTPFEAEDIIRNARGDLPIVINTTFPSAFNTTPLISQHDAFFQTVAIRKGRQIPPPEEFGSMLSKPFFLAEALRNANTNSKYDYVFYVDSTNFQSYHLYKDWPNLDRIKKVWDDGRRESGMKAEELLFMPMKSLPHVSMVIWNESFGPIQNVFTAGTFFGGTPKTVLWWERYFYTYLNHYMAQHLPVLSDEYLTNSLVLLHPERFMTVWPGDPMTSVSKASFKHPQNSVSGLLGDCGNEDFYYEFWLASEDEQEKMKSFWSGQWRWTWRWWTPRMPCRVTRVLAMEWLLRRPFGDSWRPPKGSLKIPK